MKSHNIIVQVEGLPAVRDHIEKLEDALAVLHTHIEALRLIVPAWWWEAERRKPHGETGLPMAVHDVMQSIKALVALLPVPEPEGPTLFDFDPTTGKIIS